MFGSFAEFLYYGFIGKFLELNAVSPAIFWFLMIGSFVLSICAPYFLGSINFAILISKRSYGDDIRKHGSGNAGATNMKRIYGGKAGGLTLLGDALKAVVSVSLGYCLLGYITASVAALFCMLGHMFPCYYHFRGGKGVLVTAVSVLMLEPLTGVICAVIFFLIVLATRYVSLGSVMACLLMPLVLNRMAILFNNAALQGLPNLIAIFMALLVVFMHRENIKRLLNREESKFEIGKKKRKNECEDEKDGTSAE